MTPWIAALFLPACAPEAAPVRAPEVGADLRGGVVLALLDRVPQPTVSDVQVSPSHARPGDLLSCDWVFTGVRDRSRVAWRVGDVVVGTGTTFDTSGVPVGSDVTCEVTPDDGLREGTPVVGKARLPGNVVLVIADDIGAGRLATYGVGIDQPPTPVLDGLAAQGVLFEHAWAEPTCSPGRAALLTGRDPSQTGIGKALSVHGATWLHADEQTLPELLTEGTGGLYTSAMVGKWHLAVESLGDGYRTDPNQQGFASFAGMMMGFSEGEFGDDLPSNYYSWLETIDGSFQRVDAYNTTVSTDRAIDFFATLPEPFLLVISYPAAHAPYQSPPPELVSGPAPGATRDQRNQNGTIEAMDTELGRFLDTVDPGRLDRSTVFVTSDNGTPSDLLTAPFPAGLGKGTVGEGGLWVPLLVSGLGVDRLGERSDHPVQATDLFATVAELAGVAIDDGVPRDSVSFAEALRDPAAAPAREVGYAEHFANESGAEWQRAARTGGFKLARWEGGEALFDLRTSPVEVADLLDAPLSAEAEAAWETLSAYLDARQVPSGVP
jgi:arylsulfatase A-like enzyme